MTNVELIAKIKAEIDKRYAYYREKMKTDDFTYYEGMADALDHFEQFIDTLESEKPMNQEGLDVTDFCKPIDPGIAQCIADHSWEMLGEDEKPVPKDLEEAAHLFSQSPEPLYSPGHRFHWDDDALFGKQIETAFIAGAEWQKEQMMKEAVEADVMLTLHDKTGDISLHTGYLPKELGIKCNDKVRIIIVKE